MPWPISRYQAPFLASRSTPATFQSASSAECVPDLSPRETKGAPFSAIFTSAAAMSFEPLMPAGSPFGPIRTKSLYMTGLRSSPKPSATNFSSCALAWTKTTSASPRRPVSSAWPVPCETTRTSMPVFVLNSGRIWPNRPESWVEVVEDTVMNEAAGGVAVVAWAKARPVRATEKPVARSRRRVVVMVVSLGFLWVMAGVTRAALRRGRRAPRARPAQ